MLEHFKLTGGQILVGQMFGKASSHVWRNTFFLCMDLADHVDQVFARCAF